MWEPLITGREHRPRAAGLRGPHGQLLAPRPPLRCSFAGGPASSPTVLSPQGCCWDQGDSAKRDPVGGGCCSRPRSPDAKAQRSEWGSSRDRMHFCRMHPARERGEFAGPGLGARPSGAGSCPTPRSRGTRTRSLQFLCSKRGRRSSPHASVERVEESRRPPSGSRSGRKRCAAIRFSLAVIYGAPAPRRARGRHGECPFVFSSIL